MGNQKLLVTLLIRRISINRHRLLTMPLHELDLLVSESQGQNEYFFLESIKEEKPKAFDAIICNQK
jgi:hypothetical protein